MFSFSLTSSLLHTRLARARITLRAHACHSLSPSPLPTFTFSAARRGTIKYNFTAAPQAAKERCLCLFQIKFLFCYDFLKVWCRAKVEMLNKGLCLK